ncbi:MAG: hypothetical protein IIX44_11945, partial [Clostridia bacterium]|nr:hypothetical protein [Clostridia bacterium]
MDNQIRRSRAVAGEWFYGNKVSEYGKQNGYVDYRTLAKAFDAVMNNNIMGDLENAGFYFEPVQDGSSDYTDEIDELRDAADEIRDQATEKTDAADEAEEAGDADEAEKLRAEAAELEAEAEKKEEEADELEAEQEPPECFQFFIVDDAGAEIIQEWTDDPLFYCEALDMYVWGVTHWGT